MLSYNISRGIQHQMSLSIWAILGKATMEMQQVFATWYLLCLRTALTKSQSTPPLSLSMHIIHLVKILIYIILAVD